MTVMDSRQACKIQGTVALARASAGKLERFYVAATRLDAAEKDTALREAGRLLRQADEKVAHLQEIAAALERLERAGGYRAVVLGVELDDPEFGPKACMAILGQQAQIVAGFLPGVDAEDLEPGDEIEVVRAGPDHYAVRRRVGPHERYGAVACVEEVQSPGLLRVRRGPDSLFLRSSAALARALVELGEDPADALGRMVSFDEQLGMAFSFFGCSERDDLVLREFPSVKHDELILSPRLTRFFEEHILMPLHHPDLARDFGISPSKFFLFSGPPGIGKTHAARWIASELGRPVYLISGGELADSWYGGTETKLRARLTAAENEPNGAVVVWDEAEAMLVERGRSIVGVEDRIVSLMLGFTDGFTRKGDVLMILTSNRPDKIDVALKRHLRAIPVAFERPDAPRTRQLLELYLRDVPCIEADPESLAWDATRAIFADREGIADVVLRDSARVPVTRRAAMSGALVRAACEGAQQRAFVRNARSRDDGAPRGILREDLLWSLDEQFSAVAQNLTAENVQHAATLPLETVGNVVTIEHRSDGDRRRYVCDPIVG